MWNDASARGKIFSRAQDGVRGQCGGRLLGVPWHTTRQTEQHMLAGQLKCVDTTNSEVVALWLCYPIVMLYLN